MFSSNTSQVSGDTKYIEDYFSTFLYTATGSAQTITNGIDLSTKGGLVWFKRRNTTSNHRLYDTARGMVSGTGGSPYLYSNDTAGNLGTGFAASVTASTTGFNITTDGSGIGDISDSGGTYTSWTLAKAPKFFDVVTYTGTGSNTTISHSLGSVPACIMVKRTDTTGAWQVYHRSLANTEYLVLNTTAAKATGTTRWNSTTPTSTVFSIGTDATVNASGGTYVAYLFAHDAGGFGLTGSDNVISCGSFTTNGSGAATVSLGYEPQWVLFKPSSTTGEWTLLDTMRGWVADGTNADKLLYANNSDAEAGAYNMGITATGFDTRANLGASQTHIYIAIRRGPMKVPTSGTSVFSPNASNAPANGTQVTTNFPVDLSIWKSRGGAYSGQFQDRLRELPSVAATGTVTLYPDSTSAESSNQSGYQYWNTGFKTYSAENNIWWTFGRAPSFFDVVCYTGTGSATTFNHNLGVAPELMIAKERSSTGSWWVYAAPIWGTNTGDPGYDILALEQTTQRDYNNAIFNSTQPTASVFSVGGSGFDINDSGATYVNYLFASCTGVSKVGSYTGTGTTLQVNCGFTGGARFVLIKRTDSTGAWYVWDTARGIVSGNDPYLLLNSTAAETTTTDYIDTYSAGFEISSTAPAAINASGGTFLFLAIA